MVTPVLKYRTEQEVQLAAAKEKSKRTKKHEESVQNTFEPLRDLRGWAEYAGQYQSVLLIEVAPQLRETFGSALTRGLAASGGRYGGPAHLKYKTDFYRMRLLCGGKEIEPIHPGKAATVVNAHNAFVNVTDATYVGIYSYPADAVQPSCGNVVLELYSEKEPDKPVRKVLDAKSVDRIWSDFQPYFATEALHQEVAITESKKEPDLSKHGSEVAAPVVSEASTAGGAPISTGPSENTCTIVVISEPTGAAIYVDDSPAGIALVTLKLKPGKHSIRAFKKGYQNWFRAVTVEAGQNLSLTVAMQKSE
jgi:hypothetical protein